jgi:phospholipase/lecithinase/hemolysin
MGNPHHYGWTSANGPNWVYFVTREYNESVILTYNFAYIGAPIDPTLVKPYAPQVMSLEQQIDDEFIPYYGTAMYPTIPWTSTDSLFSIFIGINDLDFTFRLNTSAVNSKMFAEYQGLTETLYYAGARNFLFFNVPPTDQSPRVRKKGPTAQALLKSDIAQYNRMLAASARTLKKQHPDVNIFTIDTNAIFAKVLENPSSYPQTSLYRNTTDYCEAYHW